MPFFYYKKRVKWCEMRFSGFLLLVITIGVFIFYGRDSVFTEETIKYPAVSGSFYPANKTALSNQIISFLDNVEIDPLLQEKDIFGLISPHAGYIYSGQVAAYGYKAILNKKYDTVVVVAPSHFYPFKGISVYNEGAFRTPLGDIEVDTDLAAELISYDEKIDFIPQAFSKEHSLEVQLPFLQTVLKDFKVIPIVMGQVDYSDSMMLSGALRDLSQKNKILIVASTDLSHYHSYDKAKKLDDVVISYIKNKDPLGLWNAVSKQECELCGFLPVLVVLEYARDIGLVSKVLYYANSGDTAGDKERVVGYASSVFYKDNQSHNSTSNKGEEMFTREQKNKLLDIARSTIRDYLIKGKHSVLETDDSQLKIERGAFVTLKKRGELRGCIGRFTSSEPLYKVISAMAKESAFGDPRFAKLSKDELDEVDIEISVLTEPQLIDDWRKIRLGVDGVIVRRGMASGVFLPQVATETGWDLETFLGHLCSSKAGLSSDCYKDPKTQIYTYQAIIFSEKELE